MWEWDVFFSAAVSRLYSPFLTPILLPEWEEDEGGALACYSFTTWAQGPLKNVEEEEEVEGGGCMGELVLLPCERSSIVPGTFQQLPRGPCSFPSPYSIHSFSLRNTNT